tara:strand:- start:18632 stop:18883 length:252 start_codon:yes stop_codon:yes gene_type:complete
MHFMSIGYSQLIISKNDEANRTYKDKIGVRLGKICIQKNVPVQIVANYFGVTRTTIYSWFSGIAAPHKRRSTEINEFIENLEA